jgi:DNA-binding winged helix-turn-helix (wHTH) protein
MRDIAGFDGVKPSRESASVVRFAGLVLDFDACLLARESGEPIPLTRGEFAVLRTFVTRPGRVISRDALLDAFTDRRFEPFDRSIDVLVGRLRKKIEADPRQPRLIVTVPGEGYRFDGLSLSLSPEQKPSIAIQAAQNDDGLSDRDLESDPLLVERPATLEAAGGAKAPMPEERKATPIATRPSEDARSPAEAESDGADQRHVTARAAQAAQVEGAKFAVSKERPALLPVAIGIAALLLLIGSLGWWFINANRAAAVASNTPAEAARLSIVVLPFTNLSNDPAQDYFADGVTEPPTCRASTTVSSSPATPLSPLKTKTSTPRRSARNSTCANPRRLGPTRRQPGARQRSAHCRGIRRASLGGSIRGRRR